eukprot:augustus_masked-scaffold_9-processed-gene-7.14-mRNA-1 protein AED:0.04 eAED:0.06 QI:0/-1/0/1/-1/1/1/0/459
MKRFNIFPTKQHLRYFSTKISKIIDAKPIIHLDQNLVEFKFANNKTKHFHTTWLADHSLTNLHPTSLQRQADSANLSPNLSHPKISYSSDHSKVELSFLELPSAFRVEFTADFLEKIPQPKSSDEILTCNEISFTGSFSKFLEKKLTVQSWDEVPNFEFPNYNFHSLIEGSEAKVLQDELLRDLDRFGAVLVHEMPDGSQSSVLGSYFDTQYGNRLTQNLKPDTKVLNQAMITENLVREIFGCPRETFYGRMWDTAPKNESEVNDTAYTKDALHVHTDGCYWLDVPGLQVFNCVDQSGEDNEGFEGCTRLVDGFSVMKQLYKTYPETFNFFCGNDLIWYSKEDQVEMQAKAKAIGFGLSGEANSSDIHFRYNIYDLKVLDFISFEKINDFYKHNQIISQVMRDEKNLKRIRLEPGSMVIINNHRVCHGREAFSGHRNLVGCYVGLDDWMSKLRLASMDI